MATRRPPATSGGFGNVRAVPLAIRRADQATTAASTTSSATTPGNFGDDVVGQHDPGIGQESAPQEAPVPRLLRPRHALAGQLAERDLRMHLEDPIVGGGQLGGLDHLREQGSRLVG